MYGIQVKRKIHDINSDDFAEEWEWLSTLTNVPHNIWSTPTDAQIFGDNCFGRTNVEWRVEPYPGELGEEGMNARNDGDGYQHIGDES